jgi:hypothetical protein
MMNNNSIQTNGQRQLRTLEIADTPATYQSEQQQLATAIDDNRSLQRVLSTISTPAGKLLKMISKSLGSAEAEIEFTERIRVREE